MCMSSPDPIVMPAPVAAAAAAPATPMQEAKTPQAASSAADSRKKMTNSGAPSGTLLTGPSGIEQSTLNLGKSTLLGG